MSYETTNIVIYREVLAKRKRLAEEAEAATVPLWARYGWEAVALFLGVEAFLLFVISSI